VEPVRITNDELITALRCYVEIDENFNPTRDILTKVNLKLIAERRLFFSYYGSSIRKDVIMDYLNFQARKSIISKYGLEVREYEHIINRFKVMLVMSICGGTGFGIFPRGPRTTPRVLPIVGIKGASAMKKSYSSAIFLNFFYKFFY
jgi:hypothetical protein